MEQQIIDALKRLRVSLPAEIEADEKLSKSVDSRLKHNRRLLAALIDQLDPEPEK